MAGPRLRRMRTEEGSPRIPCLRSPLEDGDLLSEILLRLPPQPSSLPRASLVSKGWRRVASSPAFSRRFRLRHRRSPPLLGFFETYYGISFVPTLDAPNRISRMRFCLPSNDLDAHRFGCRHGLVLVFDPWWFRILVWDAVTGDQHRLAVPHGFDVKKNLINGADAHFRVVLVTTDGGHKQPTQVLACVYSSETGLWGDFISVPLPPEPYITTLPATIVPGIPAVLVGDSLYWQMIGGSVNGILEFDLEMQSLAVIPVPVDIFYEEFCFTLVREEGGGLGFLYVSGFTGQLWKMKADCDGSASWELGRSIELDKLLSLNPKEHRRVRILGFAEENNLVFLRTDISLFMVQIQSLEFTLMKHSKYGIISPYHSFESVYPAERSIADRHDAADRSAQYI